MTEITIPVEGVKLDGNTVYKLKGLEASTTYEVTLTSDKFVNLEITEDEDEQAKVLASGALYNAPFKFTATATTARLVVEAPTGALSQPLILATYKTATGSNGWSGKAVISYLGPIS